MKKSHYLFFKALFVVEIIALLCIPFSRDSQVNASSHREAPLISEDPLADNTDLYAFRSPDNPNTITIIANYVPLQLPFSGPNFWTFGENIRYEIHIKNDPATAGDDITYRYTFTWVNEDTTTFFNIRLGARNLRTTYTCEKSMGGGAFETIVENGEVPPPNVGPRSILTPVGLNAPSYESLIQNAITTADGNGGEVIYCGPPEDPFFVDLGGIFDLGNLRQNLMGEDGARDGVAGMNVHSIAMQIPISTLQKDGLNGTDADDILDSDFIIGVWASASRQQMRTLSTSGEKPDYEGEWVQVSRLGMPLTNEAMIPIGDKDEWNSYTPYDATEANYEQYFTNPELALYMDDSQFGGAVPELSALRIQRASQTILGNVRLWQWSRWWIYRSRKSCCNRYGFRSRPSSALFAAATTNLARWTFCLFSTPVYLTCRPTNWQRANPMAIRLHPANRSSTTSCLPLAICSA